MRACGPASRAGAKDSNFVAIIERRAVGAANAAASDFHNASLAAFHRQMKRDKGKQEKDRREGVGEGMEKQFDLSFSRQ